MRAWVIRQKALAKFIARRIGLGALSMIAVSILVFLATEALPGGAAVAKLGRNATPEAVRAFDAQYDLTGSVFAQYWRWASNVIHGQLGTSLVTSVPVSTLIGGRVVNSLVLLLVAALIGIPIAVGLGLVTAHWRDGRLDHSVSISLLTLAALPEFVIGVALTVLLATSVTHVLPATSILNPQQSLVSQLNLILLPALTLALAITPYISRMIRGSMIEILESDYIALARLKGVSDRHVLVRHALPNAAGPAIQVVALVLAYLAGGVVVVETVFQYPGLGLALVSALQNRDLPTMQALVLVVAAVYIVVNITADVLVTIVSPRLRTQLR